MELFGQLVHGQTNKQTDRQTNKQTDRQTNGRTLLVPKVAITTEKENVSLTHLSVALSAWSLRSQF